MTNVAPPAAPAAETPATPAPAVKPAAEVKKPAAKKPPVAKKAAAPKPAAKKSAPKPAAKKAAGGKMLRIFRVGVLKHPRTGREIYPGVNAQGNLPPYRQATLGKKVAKWCRIRAESFGKAVQATRQGGGAGEWFTAAKGEK